MKAAELRAMQAPFKARYRESPESARAELTTRARIDLDAVTVEILREAPQPEAMGLHPMTGGSGNEACAAEKLLEALAGCAGVTFAAVATAIELPVENAEITVTGTLDFRGTLGVARDVPVGFQTVHVHFQLKTGAEDAAVDKAVQLAERYCVVAQTLRTVTADWSRG